MSQHSIQQRLFTNIESYSSGGNVALYSCPSRAGPEAPDVMPRNESGSSGSLDNSGCIRLRISSLVDMSADENPYELFGTACDLLDVLCRRGVETKNLEHNA